MTSYILYTSSLIVGSVNLTYIIYNICNYNPIYIILFFKFLSLILNIKYIKLLYIYINQFVIYIGYIHHLYYLYINQYQFILALLFLSGLNYIIDKILFYKFSIQSNYIYHIFSHLLITVINIKLLLEL